MRFGNHRGFSPVRMSNSRKHFVADKIDSYPYPIAPMRNPTPNQIWQHFRGERVIVRMVTTIEAIADSKPAGTALHLDSDAEFLSIQQREDGSYGIDGAAEPFVVFHSENDRFLKARSLTSFLAELATHYGGYFRYALVQDAPVVCEVKPKKKTRQM